MKSLIVTLKMPTNSYAFQANFDKRDHTPTEERRDGIINLYANFAEGHVEHCEKKGDVQKISREKVERQVISEIDKAKFPIEYKMSWYHAILVSLNFDAFWKGVAKRLKLPKSCTKRFEPDKTLYEYDAPTDVDEAEEGAEDEVDHEAEDDVEDEIHSALHTGVHNDATPAINATPTTTNFPPVIPQTPALTTDHESRSSSSDSDSDWSSRSGTRHKLPKLTEENKLAPHPQRVIPPMCRQCGDINRPCWCEQNNDDGDNDADCASERDSHHGGHEMNALANPLDGLNRHREYPYSSAASGNVNGSLRRERYATTYEEPSSKNKHKGKAPPTTNSYPHTAPNTTAPLTHEDADDSDYKGTPTNRKGAAKTKAKPKSKAPPTVKSAAKPKGVSKKTATPMKKAQTPAQLKTAAAKTRETALPKAKQGASSASQTKKGVTKANPATSTPAPASNPNNDIQAQLPTPPSQTTTTPAHAHAPNVNELQIPAGTTPTPNEANQKKAAAPASGLKRMLELYAEDEDSSPVTKKVRFDGAALADANEGGGGRKKAKVSGKKNVRKPIEEEWDGVPRGFGEY